MLISTSRLSCINHQHRLQVKQTKQKKKRVLEYHESQSLHSIRMYISIHKCVYIFKLCRLTKRGDEFMDIYSDRGILSKHSSINNSTFHKVIYSIIIHTGQNTQKIHTCIFVIFTDEGKRLYEG